MPPQTRQCLTDLALATFAVSGAVILLVGAAELPPPRFEPLGSAALPRILGGVLILLSVIVAARALFRLRSSSAKVSEEMALGIAIQPSRSFLTLAALIAYVFSLDVLQVAFIPATTVFVVVAGLAMGERTLRNVAVFTLLGLILSASISFILSRFLFITF